MIITNIYTFLDQSHEDHLKYCIDQLAAEFSIKWPDSSRNIREDISNFVQVHENNDKTYAIYLNLDYFYNLILSAQKVDSMALSDYYSDLRQFYITSLYINLSNYGISISNLDECLCYY